MVDHSQKRESHGAMYRIGKRLRISYNDGVMHIIVEKNRNYLKLTVNQNQGMFFRHRTIGNSIFNYGSQIIFSDSPLQPKEEKKKSLKKIEAKPKPTSSLNGAITPIKPITTRLIIYFFGFLIEIYFFSFVKMTIIPPVYSQSQLETLKSLDQLNQPGLVLLPSPQPQLLNGTSTKPKTERSYVKIEKNTKPKVRVDNKNYGFLKYILE